MLYENVKDVFNSYKNFSEYDEEQWDYLGDDEYYERTSDYDIPYDGEDWGMNFGFDF